MFADQKKLNLSPLLQNVLETNVIKTGICEVFGLKQQNANCKQRKCNSLNSPTKVIVTIYKTSSEYFAVLYPMKMLISARKPINCINLRNCRIENLKGGTLFRVVNGKDVDGNLSLIFKVSENENESYSWIEAFSHQSNIHYQHQYGSSNTCFTGECSSLDTSSNLDNSALRKGSLPTLVESDEDKE